MGAEEPHAEDHPLHIPEPLIFDLVRGLGAERGEFEANVLGEFPLGDKSGRGIEWAPEVEYAIVDGFALEFEVPFHGSEERPGSSRRSRRSVPPSATDSSTERR